MLYIYWFHPQCAGLLLSRRIRNQTLSNTALKCSRFSWFTELDLAADFNCNQSLHITQKLSLQRYLMYNILLYIVPLQMFIFRMKPWETTNDTMTDQGITCPTFLPSHMAPSHIFTRSWHWVPHQIAHNLILIKTWNKIPQSFKCRCFCWRKSSWMCHLCRVSVILVYGFKTHRVSVGLSTTKLHVLFNWCQIDGLMQERRNSIGVTSFLH